VAGGFETGPKNDANALVAPDADGDTAGAAGFGFEVIPPDVGVPKLGRDDDELGAPNANEFEPDPNPPKVGSFGTGGTGGI
jgi:hypothetical protein